MTAPYERFGSCGAWGYYLLKQEDQYEEQVGSGIDQHCPTELSVMVEILQICTTWSYGALERWLP